MALIIEDGSIVAGANSYVSLAEARAYATARNKPLPTDDTALEALLISAMDYLEAQRARFEGSKVSAEQELQYPREGVIIDGIELASNVIPSILKQAQIRLAMEANAGVDLMPTRTGGFVKKEVVGPIETEYSEKVGVSVEPEMSAVEALLAPLFAPRSVGTFLTTFRA